MGDTSSDQEAPSEEDTQHGGQHSASVELDEYGEDYG